MNLINCSSDCIYQKDGECSLNRAVSGGKNIKNGCTYYVQKNQSGQNVRTSNIE